MITNCTSGSVFTLWSKLQTVIFLKSCWHSFVPGSCQEQPRPGLSWRLIKKRDPVPVTQQLKTFTQLGPSNPEAALPYCKDLRRGNGREGEGGGEGGPGASGECMRSKDGAKDNDHYEFTGTHPLLPLSQKSCLPPPPWSDEKARWTHESEHKIPTKHMKASAHACTFIGM